MRTSKNGCVGYAGLPLLYPLFLSGILSCAKPLKDRVYIVSALRSPIGAYKGQFSGVDSTDIGSQVLSRE